jgi:hypothetical protein
MSLILVRIVPVPLISLPAATNTTPHPPYVVGRLTARHTKASHKLVRHPRRELVAKRWTPIYLGIQHAINLCATEASLDKLVDQFGPPEAAGCAVHNRNYTVAWGTNPAPDAGFSLTINALHLKNGGR